MYNVFGKCLEKAIDNHDFENGNTFYSVSIANKMTDFHWQYHDRSLFTI